jgi:hypothetical protein
LLLVAPALFAATIYMELARIVELVDGESRSLIPRRWMTKIFVVGDVLSFVLQAGGRRLFSSDQHALYTDCGTSQGGGYQASGTLEALNAGANVIIAGLFVQLLCFGIFIVTAISFNLTINRAPTGASKSNITWKRHMTALYITSTLIMIRSVFRAVEYLQGFDGYLLRHEVYLYVFDAVFMLMVMALFNYIHPREITALIRAKRNNDRLKMEFGNVALWA